MDILKTHQLSIGYTQHLEKTTVQADLNLELKGGEMVCMIGPNGCGKSTLLRTISGLQKPLAGETKIYNKNILKLSQTEKARLISLVLTDKVEVENATVYDIVSLGQLPYTHWLNGISHAQREKISTAIRMVHLEKKQHKLFNELSDGEKQRVMIAKALAQDTPVIFLDEPTAHLDVTNRVEIMLLLHKLAHQTSKSILLSTHELDLALQAADKIWLMDTEKGVYSGTPEDLVLNGLFNEVFKSEAYFFNPANGNFSMNYHLKNHISLSGDKTKMYWTLRALARAGFAVTDTAENKIEITEQGFLLNGKLQHSIEELLNSLSKIIDN